MDELDLIAAGDLSTSTHPYVVQVRAALSTIEEKLATLSKGAITTLNDSQIKSVTRPVVLQDHPRGFGFTASSVGYNTQMEMLWTAIMATSFQEARAHFHPLVLPVDTLYQYAPGNASLVVKTKLLSENNLYDAHQKPYALILTGFTQSTVFTPAIISALPSQSAAGIHYGKYTSSGEKLLDFATRKVPALLEENEGNLEKVLAQIEKETASSDEDVRLALAASLLLVDAEYWQGLWYEGKKGGVPLYIVAPQSFHDAMNRLNFSWGKGQMDYMYRARNSLGGHDLPVFDFVDGTFQNRRYFLENRKPELFLDKGLSEHIFKAKVAPILERYLK